jgi:hypothetical protein
VDQLSLTGRCCTGNIAKPTSPSTGATTVTTASQRKKNATVIMPFIIREAKKLAIRGREHSRRLAPILVVAIEAERTT